MQGNAHGAVSGSASRVRALMTAKPRRMIQGQAPHPSRALASAALSAPAGVSACETTTEPRRDRSVPSTGPHANNLKRLWAKGRLSSAEVQSLAASAEASGATGLNRLTKAGKSGAQPQHLFKQLNHIFGYPKGAAPIDWVENPTIRSRKEPHPMLMPHRFLQELYKHRQDLWQSRILGDASAPEVFLARYIAIIVR